MDRDDDTRRADRVAHLPTPEDLIDGDAEAPLEVSLTCRGCGRDFSGTFEWASLDPRADVQGSEWDGVLLSEIVDCPGCGAVDEYTVAERSLEGLRSRASRASRGRVIRAISTLWDGSTPKRPSQVLNRLRTLVAERPGEAEPLRRLGNACERWGIQDEARDSWEKARQIDPDNAELSLSLAQWWWVRGHDPQKSFAHLRRALELLPKAQERKSALAVLIVDLLEAVVESTHEPLALMAAWTGEGSTRKDGVELKVSSVDLHKVTDFERLAKFAGRPDVIGLGVTAELPESEPTILQRLLAASAGLPLPRPAMTVSPRSGHSGARISRNARCPCGSGKRFKRCCGRRA